MRQLNKKEFDMNIKHGIYLFHTPHCSVCKRQKDAFQWRISSFYLVDCSEDVEYYITTHGLDDMPCVRVYNNGNVVWEKHGLFQDLQFEQLLSVNYES